MDYSDLLRLARRTMDRLGLRPPLTYEALAAGLGDYLNTEIVVEPSETLQALNVTGITARDATRYLIHYDAAGNHRRQSLIVFHELGHIVLGHPLSIIDHTGAQLPGASAGPDASSPIPENAGPPEPVDIVGPPAGPSPSGPAPEIDPDLIDPGSVAAVRGTQSSPLFGAGVGLRGTRLWKDLDGHGSTAHLRERITSIYSSPIEWEAETFASICWGWSLEQTGHAYMTTNDALGRALSLDGNW